MTASLQELFPPQLWPIHQTDELLSPQLVVFREHLRSNLDTMLLIAGPNALQRLRPHCKTHKMSAIVKMQLDLGITKHKAATMAEAEMLAQCGVKDIVLAYTMIGPNVARAVKFRQVYPDVNFMVTVDTAESLERLSGQIVAAGLTIGALVDVNPGRDRTGLRDLDKVRDLYQRVHQAEGVTAAGFHMYDGHFHQSSPEERYAAVLPEWERIKGLRDELESAGLSIPRIICGGTPTFPVFAQFDDPALELSPGTCVFHDVGYGTKYPDLQDFRTAAVVFTRVVSRPTENRVTFDAGTKSIASDPPIPERVYLPAIPDAQIVLHNEEHLVVETSRANEYQPGDWVVALPRHVCPTSPMHKEAVVIENGEIVDRWPVTARDRQLTI
ncbi:MAG: D-TA family PLP-dependent enzyme [Planctomycetaceae bacterium]|nr:D-TA family PLP-dependent enzyme [Planctomycetaceae bacterium]